MAFEYIKKCKSYLSNDLFSTQSCYSTVSAF